MFESNVVSLSERRKLKKLKATEKEFKSYLKSLKQDQLQTEANYIIEKVNEDNLSDEFLLKSALLMDELAMRINVDNMANTINKFATNLRSKVKAKHLLQ